MIRIFGVVTLLTAFAVSLCPITAAQCIDDFVDQRADYDADPVSVAIHAKKVQFAMAVISDRTYLRDNQVCVSSALFFLGKFHVMEAMPRMIELLDYEDEDERKLYMSVRTRNERYPAIAGVAGLGKDAVPALLKALDNSKGNSIVIDNVAQTLMTIYMDYPGEGLDLLQQAALRKKDDPVLGPKLRDAAARAQ